MNDNLLISPLVAGECRNFKSVDGDSLVPASMALTACADRSARYTFVPTGSLVSRLREADWTVVRSRQVRVRDEARAGYQKHAVWFRQQSTMTNLKAQEYVMELLLINAHDGSSSYQLHAGLYRSYCANGMVMADSSFEAVRFPHRGSKPEAVVEASLKLVEAMPRLVSRVESMRGRMLHGAEMEDFAGRALALRYSENAPCAADTLLRCRRSQDADSNLWSVLNRVQENLLRGGPITRDGHRTASGRARSIRQCAGIDTTVKLNKGLWSLADEYLTRN